MKLTTVLILAACLQVSARSEGQTVTISVKNVPIKQVFREIQIQTGLNFLVKESLLQKVGRITLEVKNIKVEEVLTLCLKNQSLNYSIEGGVIVVKPIEVFIPADNPVDSSSPPIDVKGRVVNEQKEPVEGVSVIVKGSRPPIGTITDVNGFFILKGISPDITLVFSGTNVESYELKLNGKTDLATIGLETKITIGEAVIVNTGYQIIPKERETGSFTQIDNATLNQQQGSNILDRLDGTASGVLFPKQDLQGGPNFMVRGLSTINGPKNPLIVVDNFPYDGDINNINPNDVESVTILKDAAAASIWGTRAGNGVVVITTKKGRFNQPLKIDFNSSTIVTGKPDLSSFRTISSGDYIDVERTLFGEGFYDSYLSDTYSYPAVSSIVEILNNEKTGAISSGDATNQINELRKIDTRSEYTKYMYREAFAQKYAINLHGGSDKIAYYLSAGYDRSIDHLSSLNNRLTIRSDNIYKPLKNLEIALGVQYTQSDNKSGKPGYGSIRTGPWLIPYLNFADGEGKSLPIATRYRQTYTDTAGNGKLLNWKYYPIDDYHHNVVTVNQQDLLANIGLKYGFANGLSFDVKYLYERQNISTRSLQDLQSFETRNLINQFSQVDRNTGYVNYVVPLGGILTLSTVTLESNNIRGQVNYNHSWYKQRIDVLAGGEIRQAHTTGNGDRFYGYDGNTLITSNVDLVNSYPTFINGSYSDIPSGSFLTSLLNRYVSFYGNASYTYDNKYTISASGRRDASNLFGVSTNNKWNPLWSGGAAWQISNESFYHTTWLPYLKFRATYGFSGNTDPARTGVVTLVYNNPSPPTNLPSTRVNQYPNPELRWEKVRLLNIGFDFQSRKQIVTGTIEAYYKKGIYLFGDAPIDPTTGLNSSFTRNIANMEGRGLDLTINTKNIDKSVKWYSVFLFSYNSSKTSKYYVDSNLLSGSFISDGLVNTPIPGKPLYSLAALRWAGLDGNGNPQGFIGKDISSDYYEITQNTPKAELIYKPILPTFFGSLINSVTWKGFTIIANIRYRFGYYFLKPSINYSTLYNNGATTGSSDFSKRWQHAGDESITNVPSMLYPGDAYRDLLYNYSEILIEKAGNIKLQYVNLSYEFLMPKGKLILFRNLQLYVNASNLGILWKANKDGIDPDFISSPAQGKTYTIGVRASF